MLKNKTCNKKMEAEAKEKQLIHVQMKCHTS